MKGMWVICSVSDCSRLLSLSTEYLNQLFFWVGVVQFQLAHGLSHCQSSISIKWSFQWGVLGALSYECSIRDVYARSWISGDALASESANNRPLLGGVLKKPPTPMAHEVKRGTRASRIERENACQPESRFRLLPWRSPIIRNLSKNALLKVCWGLGW